VQQTVQSTPPPSPEHEAPAELPNEEVRLRELSGRQIFLSYRSRDEPQVQGLRVLLGCLGNGVTKMGEFPPGRWGPHIYQRLAISDILLIYLSREPERPRFRVVLENAFRKLKRFWLEVILRRTAAPEDWMREEFEHFRKLHGDSRNIIVYAEADAKRPSYLREYQVHYFATQLTNLRETWNKLRLQGIGRREAKRIMLNDLSKLGIRLGDNSKDVLFDMFGVTGLRSAGRYLWTQAYTTFSKLYIFGITSAVILLVAGVGYSVPRISIPVPGITQVPIIYAQNGTMACERQNLVCVSVSQTSVSAGGVDGREFYGYTTPTCDSRIRRTTECREWQTNYAMTGVKLVKSRTSSVRDRVDDGLLCLSEPRYESANCVDPLGN
jgi:hypothetical protein